MNNILLLDLDYKNNSFKNLHSVEQQNLKIEILLKSYGFKPKGDYWPSNGDIILNSNDMTYHKELNTRAFDKLKGKKYDIIYISINVLLNDQTANIIDKITPWLNKATIKHKLKYLTDDY